MKILNVLKYQVKMNKQIILFIMAVFFSCFSLAGQDTGYFTYGMDTSKSPAPLGLKAGDKAPDFSGYDQQGSRVQSKKILESGPIVLFFYLGKWSSDCSKYLNNYQDSLDILTGMGVNLVAVTPESIENVEQTVNLHNLKFTVIYDCQEQIMKDYDVMFDVARAYQDSVLQHISVDIAKNNGRDVAHLPVPATYIINREGIIVAVYFNQDFHERASVKWMIKNIARAI
jgi:peroxiredoxin